MAKSLPVYQPPVGFYYTVEILEDNRKTSTPMDTSFQEVSGITVTMGTETIAEGGVNRYVHKVPGRTTYEDLVLKRGLLTQGSHLAIWCQETLMGNLNEPIKPKTVVVSLLDASQRSQHESKAKPIMIWRFTNAYPVKWEVSGFDAKVSQLMVESITLTYSYFNLQPAPR